MSAKHTPTPWRTASAHPDIIKQDSGCDEVVGESRNALGSMDRPEDAAFVVQCVNAHEDLLQTAVMVRDVLATVVTSETFHRDPRGDNVGPALDALDAAIRRATGASQHE